MSLRLIARHHVARREIAERVLPRHERFAVVVAQDRALSAQRFGEQRARHRRVMQRGGVELHELEIGNRDAGAQRHRDAVAGGQQRVRGDREALAGAAGGDDGVGRAQHPLGPLRVDGNHSRCAAVLDEQVGGEPSLVDFRTRSLDRDGQCSLDLGTRRVAARVDDAGDGVAALSSEREGSVDAVEVSAQRHELADAPVLLPRARGPRRRR